MMHILMTGWEGMIGSRLSKYLGEKGHKITKFEGDVTDEDAWADHYGHSKINMIIHLAALAGVRDSMKYPDKYYHANVNGTRNMFEFAHDALVDRVLYASSSNAYEWWGNPYAATKKMNEVQAECYSGIASVGMRFHTVWPGRDDMLFRKLENNKVTYINTGHTRDFIHIIDLMRAIEMIIRYFDKVFPEKVVDIGTGKSIKVSEVAKLFDFDGTWVEANPAGERVKTCANIEWLKKLEWSPRYDILNKDHHVDYQL